MRWALAAAMVLALVGACRGKGRAGPHDARKDGGVSSGVVPPARGSASDDPTSAMPGTTTTVPPVSPPIVTVPANVASCSTVGNAIVAWQRLEQLYTELLPLAKANKWSQDDYDTNVFARYRKEVPGGGDSGAPGPSTGMCSCKTKNVDEACAWYAANGKPAIVCEAARKHENVHVAQCKAHTPTSVPPYTCQDDKADIPPASKEQLEREAYDAHLAVLRQWFADQKCNTPLAVNPCSLITYADAATALGRELEGVEGQRIGGMSNCTFWGEHSHDPVTRPSQMNMASVSIGVVNMDVTLDQFKTKTIPTIEPTYHQPPIPLEGIGDAAVAVGPGDKVSGTIMLHQGTRVVVIIVWVQRGNGSVDYLEAAKTLGAVVAKRLPK